MRGTQKIREKGEERDARQRRFAKLDRATGV